MKFQNNKDKGYTALNNITDEMYWAIVWLRRSLLDKESQTILKKLCLEYLKIVDNLPDNDQT